MPKSFGAFLRERTAVVPPNLLKCYFLAGGPGSGKSSAAFDAFAVSNHGEQSISAFGLMYTASDVEFEKLLHANGIDPKDLDTLEHTDSARYRYALGTLRPEAKRITDAQRDLYMSKRLGMVWDGTGADYDEKVGQKTQLESLGYDTFLIYAQTSLQETLDRNAKRDRVLPEDMVIAMWSACEANRTKYQALFGSRYYEVERGNTTISGIKNFVAHTLHKPVANPIGRAWLEQLRAK